MAEEPNNKPATVDWVMLEISKSSEKLADTSDRKFVQKATFDLAVKIVLTLATLIFSVIAWLHG